jgi:hypothetical protein
MGVNAGMLRKTAKLTSTSGALDVDLTQTWEFSDLRGTLGADLAAGGFKVTGLGAPSSNNDAATKTYVDGLIATTQAMIAGLAQKDDALYATTANLAATYSNGSSGVGATLTGSSNGAISVDGGSPTVGDRILVKNQTTGAQNGVYVVTTVGDGSNPFVLTRAVDADSASDLSSMLISVALGSTNADTTWYLATTVSTLGTTSLSYSAFGGVSYTAGVGITLSGGEFSAKVDNSTIYTNGSDQLALKDLGTTPAKLSWKWAEKEFTDAAASASVSGGVSTFTLNTSINSAAMQRHGSLVQIMTDGLRADFNGVAFKQVAITPAAAGEFQLTGSSLKIYGDWSTAPANTHLFIAHPVDNA